MVEWNSLPADIPKLIMHIIQGKNDMETKSVDQVPFPNNFFASNFNDKPLDKPFS